MTTTRRERTHETIEITVRAHDDDKARANTRNHRNHGRKDSRYTRSNACACTLDRAWCRVVLVFCRVMNSARHVLQNVVAYAMDTSLVLFLSTVIYAAVMHAILG
jgi:hypothetical protein